MNIGLYFGSFNPIHIGHLIIANTVLENTKIEKIWFVVSPQNPLKDSSVLFKEEIRLQLTAIAIEQNENFEICDIEFQLSKPSYTIDTLNHLRQKYPSYSFSIIMGSDSFNAIDKWKSYNQILSYYSVFVYERPGSSLIRNNPNTITIEGPLLDISSTYIRNLIQQGKSVRYLIPDNVREIIESNKYFQEND